MVGLGVAQAGSGVEGFEVVQDMAPGDVDVEIPVKVVVKEAGAEAERVKGRLSQAASKRVVIKEPIALSEEERVGLLGKIGQEVVLQAIAIDVSAVDPHAGLGAAGGVEGDAGFESRVFEFAAAQVAPEEVRHRVVGDEEVDVAVGIEVGGQDAEALGEDPATHGDPGRAGDVLESPSAAVEVERVGSPIVFVGVAVGGGSSLAAGAGLVDPGVVEQVVGDVEVEQAIAVDVCEAGARAPEGSPCPRGGCSIAEGAIAIVDVEHVAAEVGDVEVRVAIVIDVADGEGGAVVSVADPGLVGYVDKASLAGIAEQAIAGVAGSVGPGRVAVALHEVEVEMAVSIVVEPAGSAVDRLGEQFRAAGAVYVAYVKADSF